MGWAPLNEELHFHDLRHTHETWLIEDDVPRILRLVRLGHKRRDIDDRYAHVTDTMIEQALAALQARWELYGTWSWDDEQLGGASGVTSTEIMCGLDAVLPICSPERSTAPW